MLEFTSSYHIEFKTHLSAWSKQVKIRKDFKIHQRNQIISAFILFLLQLLFFSFKSLTVHMLINGMLNLRTAEVEMKNEASHSWALKIPFPLFPVRHIESPFSWWTLKAFIFRLAFRKLMTEYYNQIFF